MLYFRASSLQLPSDQRLYSNGYLLWVHSRQEERDRRNIISVNMWHSNDPWEVRRFNLISNLSWLIIHYQTYSDKNCDFRIQLPSVAEKQIKINIDNDGKVIRYYGKLYTINQSVLLLQVFISNIGDSNSMQLNGMPLTNSSFVPHNSIINIGSFKFRFHYSSDLADQMHVSAMGALRLPLINTSSSFYYHLTCFNDWLV